MWISGLLIVGSLLAVVVGDALITQGQVRLSSTQRALAAAEADQKSLQIAVAMKAAPPVVVSQAKSQGLVAASQVVYLPQVPLNVPLPPPRIVPAPAGTASAASTPPPSNATPPRVTPGASTSSKASTAAPASTAPSTSASSSASTTATTAASPPTTTLTTVTTAPAAR
jgi:hypothetical protein